MVERGPQGGIVPLGDQEAIGCDAQRGVVMEASPAAPLEMPEPDLLLELLIVALDAPTQLGHVHQRAERNVVRKRGEPIFGLRFLALWPLDQQPLFRPGVGDIVIAMRDTNTHARKARGQSLGRTFSPFDPAPGSLGQRRLTIVKGAKVMSGPKVLLIRLASQ